MEATEKAGATATVQDQKGKKQKPTKVLPTERINIKKQLELLRAYAIASGPAGKAVTNKEVAEMLNMNEGTPSLANGFFVDTGILQRGEGGLVPSAEVQAFARAYEWNQDTAFHKVAPLLEASWFGQSLGNRLRLRSMEESEAITILADAASAAPEYKTQLRTLIDFLELSGLVTRDGSQIKSGKATSSTGGGTSSHDKATTTAQPEREHPAKVAVSTAFTQPTEGVVQFHVSVKVDMKEFAGWDPGRITAFFGGIAQVLAAKGNLEKGASGDK